MATSHRLIRERPLPVRPKNRKDSAHWPQLTNDKLVRAEARYESGATLKTIAVDLGISRQSLSTQLRKRGVKLRGRTPKPHEVEEMRRCYGAGESLERIGTKLGFSAGTVHTWLIADGVVMRDHHGRER